jgi:hypothetical protein
VAFVFSLTSSLAARLSSIAFPAGHSPRIFSIPFPCCTLESCWPSWALDTRVISQAGRVSLPGLFLTRFFRGRETSYYGGPEPLEMEDLGVDLIMSAGGSQRVLRGLASSLDLFQC